MDKLLDEAKNEINKLSMDERAYLLAYLMGSCSATVRNSEIATKDQKLYVKTLLEDIIDGCKHV